jgi:hypothetical protein
LILKFEKPAVFQPNVSSKIYSMKSLTVFAFLFFLSLVLSPGSASAAIAKSSPLPEQIRSEPINGNISKKEKRQVKRWARLKAKLEKKFEKIGERIFNGTARDYLFISLGLLAAAIIFFALNGPAGVFNVFGSIAAIGAVVFFVLWLLKMKKG